MDFNIENIWLVSRFFVFGSCLLAIASGITALVDEAFLSKGILMMYLIIFSGIIVAAELSVDILLVTFPFLKSPKGRGIFIVFVGTMGLGGGTTFSLAAGIIQIISGISCIVLGFINPAGGLKYTDGDSPPPAVHTGGSAATQSNQPSIPTSYGGTASYGYGTTNATSTSSVI